MTKKSKADWIKWTLQIFVAPIVTSLVVMIIGKAWTEKKMDQLRSEISISINSIKSKTITNNIKNKSKAVLIGEKNQALTNAGNNNVAIQNITETKPDFTKDSDQSKIVSQRIKEGVALTKVSDCAFLKEEDFNQYVNQVNLWLTATSNDLGTISNKAHAAFIGTSTNLGMEEIVTFSCPNAAVKSKEVFLTRKRVDRYVSSLREIIKGL